MDALPNGYICQFCVASAVASLMRSEMHAIGTYAMLYGKVKDGELQQ